MTDQNSAVRTLLDAGAATVTIDPGRCQAPALSVAIRFSRDDTSELILEHGASVHDQWVEYNGCSWAPLEIAILYGSRDGTRCPMAELLLKQGADVNPKGRVSALQLAAQNEDIAMVKLLLENGSDVNHNPHSIIPPALYAATTNGRLNMMAMLLNAGANVNIGAKEVNKERGQNSLHVAVELRDRPASVALVKDANINVNVGHGCLGSVLRIAVLDDNLDQVKMLLSHGADANLAALTCYGKPTESPLRLAAQSRRSLAIAEALLEAGALVNPSSDGRELEWLFTDAVYHRHVKLAKLLLGRVADSPFRWPLDHKLCFTPTVRMGQLEIWNMLLDYVSDRDHEHLPLAFRCSIKGSLEIMRATLSICHELSSEDLVYAKEILESEIRRARKGLRECTNEESEQDESRRVEPGQDEVEQYAFEHDYSEQDETESRQSKTFIFTIDEDGKDDRYRAHYAASLSSRSISSANDIESEDEDEDQKSNSSSMSSASSQYSLSEDWGGKMYRSRYWQFILGNALAKIELLQESPQWLAIQQERQDLPGSEDSRSVEADCPKISETLSD